jgi:hypothetical protein
MEKKKIKVSKKFTAIAKVGWDASNKKNICVKYRFDKVDNFIAFMQRKYTNIYWINIYYKTGVQKGKLCYTWGKHKGLQNATW